MPDSFSLQDRSGKGAFGPNRVPPAAGERFDRVDRRAAGVVRPLEERDLERIAQLHERGTSIATPLPRASLKAQLSRLLMHHPGRDGTSASLVFEDQDGNIAGSIGVMPRPMLFRDRPVIAAVSHSFTIAPGSPRAVAVELARAFLAGPQDLSLAEGGNMSRGIWERAGGCTTLQYSLRWTRPLRSSRSALTLMRYHGTSPLVGRQLRPAFRPGEFRAESRASGGGIAEEPAMIASELDAATLCRAMDEFSRDRPLRPRYDEYSCAWLLETLVRKPQRGTLRKVALHDRRREVVGWYVYYGAPGEIGTAVQVGARAGWAGAVLNHLFDHARRHGLIAISGQADPALFHELAGNGCFFHHEGGSWELLHSRHPQLLRSVHRGDAFLSRSEGEWWISSLLS